MKKKSMLFLIVSIFFTSISVQISNAQTWNLAGNGNANAGSLLGTTNNVPVNIATNGNPRITVAPSGFVGIGTTSPVNILTVQLNGSVPAPAWLAGGSSLPAFLAFGENQATGFNIATAANPSGYRPVLNTRRSRGTLAAPTSVRNNDYLASYVSSGYDGSTFQNPASIDFYVDGIPSAGNVPSRISFVTGSNAGNRLERLKVGSTGDISVVSGNLIMGSAGKTIQFATPDSASVPMITLFPTGTQNPDRMVLGHSPAYTNWGLEYQDALDKFNFLADGIPVLTTDLGSRRVGIGTSSPTLGKLVVEGVAGNTVAVFRGSQTSKGISLVADYPGVYFNSYWNAGQKALSSGYAGILNFDPVLGSIYLGNTATPAVNAGDAVVSSAALLLTKDGNVGIGTQSPAARLQVVAASTVTTPVISATGSFIGNVDVRGIQSNSKAADGYGYGVYGTGGYMGGRFTGEGGAYTGAVYGVYGSASGTAGTRYGVYGFASGGTENWGGYFPTKTYTSELRVGGTKGASGYVAAINGRLIATEVRVELTANWPDYVFKKGYDLMPIEKLEAKINTDNHLPGIPAASEMKENGIMLGEMQTKTIEKVEENTLYIIQLNNKIKLLEKQKDEENTLLNNKIKLLENKIDELSKRLK